MVAHVKRQQTLGRLVHFFARDTAPRQEFMSKRIPNYALYGQAALPVWQDLLHLEWINERGDMHQREIKPHQHDSLLQIVYVRSGEGEGVDGADFVQRPAGLDATSGSGAAAVGCRR